MNNTTDDKAVLSRVLDRWKSAVGAHEPQQVAACFTDDAIFQGACTPTAWDAPVSRSTTRPSRWG